MLITNIIFLIFKSFTSLYMMVIVTVVTTAVMMMYVQSEVVEINVRRYQKPDILLTVRNQGDVRAIPPQLDALMMTGILITMHIAL